MSQALCRKNVNVKKCFDEWDTEKCNKFKLEFIDRGRYFFIHGSSYWKPEKILGLLWNCNKRGNKLPERGNFFQFCSSVNQKEHNRVTSVAGDLKILVRSIMEGMWQPDLICEGY